MIGVSELCLHWTRYLKHTAVETGNVSGINVTQRITEVNRASVSTSVGWQATQLRTVQLHQQAALRKSQWHGHHRPTSTIAGLTALPKYKSERGSTLAQTLNLPISAGSLTLARTLAMTSRPERSSGKWLYLPADKLQGTKISKPWWRLAHWTGLCPRWETGDHIATITRAPNITP